MFEIIKKFLYIFLILVVNLYICFYINSKLVSRMELRRGAGVGKAGGILYPAVRFFGYLSKNSKLNVWEVLIFLISFLIWSVIPITSNLILVDIDFGLFIGLFFYFLLLVLYTINGSNSSYKFITSSVTKKAGMLFSFFIPILFNILGVVLISKTFSIKEIVNAQYQYWNVVFQPLGFIIVFIAVLFNFKISGLRNSDTFLFFDNIDKEGKGLGRAIVRLSGYFGLFFLIILLNLLYFGGWQRLYFIRGELMLAIKFYVFFIIILLIDKATPNLNDYRYLSSINWKFLVPISCVNILLTIGFLAYRNIFDFI